MTGHHFVQGIFVVAGIISLAAAIFDWDWFFTARNSQSIVRWAGRKRARILYGMLGILLIVMAAWFYGQTK
ncbi:immunity 17 family protein [Oscillospiraceae bacterium N12]|jgi:small neutral amino acid transporter SnatA (MarC family)|uniref:Immunity 17 family protein n=1 Tax=Jilunia laotingensis TaxID=2763675 RepID=A0A926IPV0_9BACT|nr:immunity 17 family protein [Jilunia laotingensis]MBC8592078.1 immunity 17 family protein [Jilunia laotingensis]